MTEDKSSNREQIYSPFPEEEIEHCAKEVIREAAIAELKKRERRETYTDIFGTKQFAQLVEEINERSYKLIDDINYMSQRMKDEEVKSHLCDMRTSGLRIAGHKNIETGTCSVVITLQEYEKDLRE